MIAIALAVVLAAAPVPLRNVADPGSDDYPAASLRNNEHGTVGYRVEVDAGGIPVECVVTRSSTFAALDDRTCRIASARMRFTPARDDTGRAIAGSYDGLMRWEIRSIGPGPGYIGQIALILPSASAGEACTVERERNTSAMKLACTPEIAPATRALLDAPAETFIQVGIIERLFLGGGIAAGRVSTPYASVITFTGRLTIGPAGRIDDCSAAPGAPAALDPCALLVVDGPPQFAPSEGGTVREATVFIRVVGLRRSNKAPPNSHP